MTTQGANFRYLSEALTLVGIIHCVSSNDVATLQGEVVTNFTKLSVRERQVIIIATAH